MHAPKSAPRFAPKFAPKSAPKSAFKYASKSAPKSDDRRLSRRRLINRTAKIQFTSGALPRDCLITDISDGGVRLHVEGFDVPDDFVLLLTGDDVADKERAYRVVWRLGFEVGARLMGVVRRSGFAARG